jgi:hypothetical protein
LRDRLVERIGDGGSHGARQDERRPEQQRAGDPCKKPKVTSGTLLKAAL